MSHDIHSHLQFVSQHAFLAILTHNPLHSGRYVTLIELQTDDSSLTAIRSCNEGQQCTQVTDDQMNSNNIIIYYYYSLILQSVFFKWLIGSESWSKQAKSC